MRDDPKVTAIFKARRPRLHCKPDEPYDVARARWRARLAAYDDAYAMVWCGVYSNRLGRAFYGVELKYMLEVI